MNSQLLDLYSDYLICSFGQTTATGLSALLAGSLSHDKITRFLSEKDFTSKDLWRLARICGVWSSLWPERYRARTRS